MSVRRAVLLLAAVACAHGRPSSSAAWAPASDAEAMKDAAESFEPQRHVSPRAYRHYLDALLARGAEDYPAAAAELREALLYDPESPHLHTVLAEVLLKQGRVGDAAEGLRGAVALDAAPAPARPLLARLSEAREPAARARHPPRAAPAAAPRHAR